MAKKENTYDDYLNGALNLASNIFGKKIFKKMKKRKLVTFDYDGVDITSTNLLKTSPNIKQRFTKGYLNEDDSMLGWFINSIFQFGYDQCANTDLAEMKEERDKYRLWVDEGREDRVELLDELKQYKEKFGKL